MTRPTLNNLRIMLTLSLPLADFLERQALLLGVERNELIRRILDDYRLSDKAREVEAALRKA